MPAPTTATISAGSYAGDGVELGRPQLGVDLGIGLPRSMWVRPPTTRTRVPGRAGHRSSPRPRRRPRAGGSDPRALREVGGRLRRVVAPSAIAKSPHRAPAGSTFSGFMSPRRVERRADAVLCGEVLGREHERHELPLLETDPVLARKRPTRVDAQARRSPRSRRARVPGCPASGRSNDSSGWRLPSPGVEHVRDDEVVVPRDRVDAGEDLDEAGARDDAIVQVVVRCDLRDGAERRLPPLPDQARSSSSRATRIVRTSFARAAPSTAPRLRVDGVGPAVDLHDQDRRRVGRVAGVREVLGRDDDARGPSSRPRPAPRRGR